MTTKTETTPVNETPASAGRVIDPVFISKMSIRQIKVTPAKHVNEGKSTPVARIYGIADGIKVVVDKLKDERYEALSGQFEAENLESGEIFRSGLLYLPTGIHDAVANAAKKIEDENGSVNFAMEIRVVKSSNAAGYSYEAVNLIPAAVVDPLEAMRKAVETKLALPAPAKK